MNRMVRVAGLATGRGKIMRPKIDEEAVRVRGCQIIVEPRRMKPFVFYPVSLDASELIIHKTLDEKIIVFVNLETKNKE